MMLSALQWTATSTTLSLLGSGTCTGSIVCSGGGSSSTTDCASSPFGRVQCGDSYTLSLDQNTLTVGGLTYTRR